MKQLDRIEDLLQNHIKDSADKHTQIQKTLTQVETYSKQNSTAIINHEKEIEELKAAKNKTVGAMWLIGIIWVIALAVIGALLSLPQNK